MGWGGGDSPDGHRRAARQGPGRGRGLLTRGVVPLARALHLATKSSSAGRLPWCRARRPSLRRWGTWRRCSRRREGRRSRCGLPPAAPSWHLTPLELTECYFSGAACTESSNSPATCASSWAPVPGAPLPCYLLPCSLLPACLPAYLPMVSAHPPMRPGCRWGRSSWRRRRCWGPGTGQSCTRRWVHQPPPPAAPCLLQAGPHLSTVGRPPFNACRPTASLQIGSGWMGWQLSCGAPLRGWGCGRHGPSGRQRTAVGSLHLPTPMAGPAELCACGSVAR